MRCANIRPLKCIYFFFCLSVISFFFVWLSFNSFAGGIGAKENHFYAFAVATCILCAFFYYNLLMDNDNNNDSDNITWQLAGTQSFLVILKIRILNEPKWKTTNTERFNKWMNNWPLRLWSNLNENFMARPGECITYIHMYFQFSQINTEINNFRFGNGARVCTTKILTRIHYKFTRFAANEKQKKNFSVFFFLSGKQKKISWTQKVFMKNVWK